MWRAVRAQPYQRRFAQQHAAELIDLGDFKRFARLIGGRIDGTACHQRFARARATRHYFTASFKFFPYTISSEKLTMQAQSYVNNEEFKAVPVFRSLLLYLCHDILALASKAPLSCCSWFLCATWVIFSYYSAYVPNFKFGFVQQFIII